MPIDLRSDTITQPTLAMREAMARAEVGDDVFGDDPTVARLEARTAEILGMSARVCQSTMGSAHDLQSAGLRRLLGDGHGIRHQPDPQRGHRRHLPTARKRFQLQGTRRRPEAGLGLQIEPGG